MFCQWEFITSSAFILVEFNTFNVESGYDYVYVGLETGVGPRARELRYTGSSVPSPWFSNSTFVTISMFTDYSVTKKGFQVTLIGGKSI